MVNTEQANEILNNEISAAGAKGGAIGGALGGFASSGFLGGILGYLFGKKAGSKTNYAANKLKLDVKTTEYFTKPYIQNQSDALKQFFIQKKGKILENTDKYIAGITYAGYADVNPCVLSINIEQNKLNITAYAKEGLIKQNTANKGIEKLLGFLEEIK